jgi:two-component system, OmpR family, sensor histidine kinase BaeS
MTDGGAGPSPPATRTATIGLRLTLAFVAVALAAVALLAGLTAALAAADVSHLAGQQRTQITSALAASAGAAFERTGSWTSADLSPTVEMAARLGADVQVRDRIGQTLAASPRFGTDVATAAPVTAPVLARGHVVGLAVIRFTGAGFGGADHELQTTLLRAIAGAAGLAALLALLTGLVVARRITRPVGSLIEVTRAMGRGDRSARVGQIHAPGELRELATAFDQMADTLALEDRLRRDVVADVAHELRTPIAVLQAGHEALLDRIAEPTPGQLASLRDEVLRLARMVDDLQALAAAEAAALQMTVSRCDLAEIADAAADSLIAQFEAAGLTVVRQLAPVWVRGDRGRLHQVITNLLTNALKFTPPGGRVVIQAGPDSGGARLQVADTGIGISADELPRIFDRFWRGSQAGHVAGSGVGLAVAAELARAHGGQLTAASEPGDGTSITLTIPAPG